jgi:pimeloyl-ACP methyl ester carboxylesterase
VFTYDRRGRGDSSDTQPYAVEREVEDLEALIREAGGSACVFGGSSGGALALEAVNRGLAITKLALYELPFMVDPSGPRLPENFTTHLAEMIAVGRPGDALECYMKDVMNVPSERLAHMRNAPFWPALLAMAHTLVYDFTILGDTMTGTPLPIQKWASVTVPTLVIDGGASPALFHNAAQALVDVLPNAQRRTLAGQDHAVDPHILAPLLEEFFGHSDDTSDRL